MWRCIFERERKKTLWQRWILDIKYAFKAAQKNELRRLTVHQLLLTEKMLH